MNAEQARERAKSVQSAKNQVQEITPDDKSKIDGFKRSEVWTIAIAEIRGAIDSHPTLEMVVLPEVGNPDKELLRMTLLADGYRVNELGSSLVAMWNKKDILKRRFLV